MAMVFIISNPRSIDQLWFFKFTNPNYGHFNQVLGVVANIIGARVCVFFNYSV